MESRTCIAAGLSMEVANEAFINVFFVDIMLIDLHLGNILLRIPGIEQMSPQDLQRYLGEPYKKPLERWDGDQLRPLLTNQSM